MRTRVLLTILCLVATITLTSSSKLHLQNLDEAELFDCKANSLKLSAKVDGLVEDNQELMKYLREVMRENKEIMFRLNILENSSEINASKGLTSDPNLIAKVEKLEETTNEINKAFSYIQNTQTKIQMKTVKIDADLNAFKTNQDHKVTELKNDTTRQIANLQKASMLFMTEFTPTKDLYEVIKKTAIKLKKDRWI